MIKLYNEDCVSGMKRLSDNSIDLTVTSPPYDNLRTYNGHAKDFKFEETAQELWRVTKQGGVVVWVVSDATIKGSETGTSFRQALYFKEIGFRLHDTMIYQKKGVPYPETNRYYPNFEYMFVLSKGRPKTVNLIADKKNIWSGSKITGTQRKPDGSLETKNGTKIGRKYKEYGVRYNVWQYNAGYTSKNSLRYKHPAIFPLELAEDHIKSWSNEGDIVLDCFMGSGTTGIAAINTGRNFVGFEIDKVYFDLAQQRIKEETGNHDYK